MDCMTSTDFKSIHLLVYMIHRISSVSNPHIVFVVASGSRTCVPPDIQLRSLYVVYLRIGFQASMQQNHVS